MKTIISTLWRVSVVFIFITGGFAPGLHAAAGFQQPFRPVVTAMVQAPAVVVDGVIDAAYGPPIAVDPAGDGNGSANLDLLEMYVTQDADNYYFAFTINADINATNWGKYAIYLDTDGVDNSGASSDAWTRNVVAENPHRPEYALYSWVDCPAYNASCTQFWQWSGGGWSQAGTIDEAAKGTGVISTLEWRMTKAHLGMPSHFWLEVWDTGGGSSDNAQDTINDPANDWNATDWLSTAHLQDSTPYPSVQPIQLNVTFPPQDYYTGTADIQATGVVSPTSGVTVTVGLNGSAVYTPTVDSSGAFTQPLTLAHGTNTLTFTALEGLQSTGLQRTVHFGGELDGNILWDQLGHNSRDALFRTPGGAVTTGTPVTLRFRAASGDLSGVTVRLWNDRLNVQSQLVMDKIYDDGYYEWWQTTVPASSLPTVYWYRFIPQDGTAVAYYEDDPSPNGSVLGGWGAPAAASSDRSWQLTVYDPAFQTPDWIKNAVVYQIFPDRFYDGDPTNNVPAGSFFYNDPHGTIVRSNGSDWNTVVCDPRQAGTACTDSYSRNFYGGDLQGLIDKLTYLHNLGITAIYLNPIFDSPSNHKYDTTDYSQIDPAFGDQATFNALVQQADALGMHLILDGVFNHVSSDSIYFDRYHRYDSVGACESPDSPYRDWFYFRDVYPGTGACVGSDGTPNGASYESWAGYDSLPKLNSSNPGVRALIWSQGVDSIGPYWAQWTDGWRLDVAGEVDPGTTGDPTNNYWEGFRTAVHAANPDAYIVGEEWGIASSWTLGGEWDATMNYQFGTSILSFWRDTSFSDNDHNTGSSLGVLIPLTPSQLDERLHNLQERYAPQAFYAMLNLLDSHDTNRALFELDPNTNSNDTSLYWNPSYDWSEAINRLKGVAILQFTLPGAPTIYYGDEVGLVGPPVYVDYGGGNAKWEDDPYNRQPYPWLEAGLGQPYYTSLQSQVNQDALREVYQSLIAARNAHPALRTGTFDTLLTDDTTGVYAYGRRMTDGSDAALVLVNQSATLQNVTLNVKGYLPYAAELSNVLAPSAPNVTVDGLGQVEVAVPAKSGVVLVLASGAFAIPPAVSDLSVAAEGQGQVTLAWSAAPGATSYDLYRSVFDGGGYEWITHTITTVLTDTGLTNGQEYYYVAVSVADSTGMHSGYSNQASGLPHYTIAIAFLRTPQEIMHTVGITPTEDIFGDALITGITPLPGPADDLIAQVGFGITSTPPVSWTNWVDAPYSGEFSVDDEFSAGLTPELTGEFAYLYRLSTTNGRDWVYAGLVGFITPTLPAQDAGLMHVVYGADTTPPQVPHNLTVTLTTATSIGLAWDPNPEPDLAGYDVYRQPVPGGNGPGLFVRVARIPPDEHSFIDTDVVTDQTYEYFVIAFDRNFNTSTASDFVQATAKIRLVAVSFQVTVPSYTLDTVFIAGDIPGLPSWSPGALEGAMTRVNTTTVSLTLDIAENTLIQFKFARGSWETVEKDASGGEIPNRELNVVYGTDGTMLANLTVVSWRDPLVTGFTPHAGATGVPTDTVITVAWSKAMNPDVTLVVSGPQGVVSGTVSYDAGAFTVTFTPIKPLERGTQYTVTVLGQADAAGNVQQIPAIWRFTIAGNPIRRVYIPLIGNLK